MSFLTILCMVCFGICSSQNSTKGIESEQNLEWTISNFINNNSEAIQITGNPKIVSSPYGNAVYFNGVEDAFFLKENPLKNLEEFTIEMIFNPSIGGEFEQRIVHLGEISGDRMLLEIRAINGHWYFDGFVASKTNKLALIDETLLHPLGKWYHVVFVVTKNSLSTYVNGKLELTEPFLFSPIQSGQTSIGVRMNKRSWFKGTIYKIKISPQSIESEYFMDFKL